jgi:hypothetical protein
MPDRENVIHELELLIQREKVKASCDCDGYDIDVLEVAIALLKEQREQIDKLLEESASNAEMAEGMKELLKEQQEIIEQYHKADGFLDVHGWKW